ncbi:flagellar protein FlaG [Caldimicrobium thiodismutans]|jgi:uncharacterized FlaG/YvyC family protein|uniref:flagellar protein FlaG n=1 Tax=Caldimicrobium thiodismutans TaxID=1653476 RepID=UPI00083814E3|nr:flagellar protein FlaG [Caldimicrobium thiodismutans]
MEIKGISVANTKVKSPEPKLELPIKSAQTLSELKEEILKSDHPLEGEITPNKNFQNQLKFIEKINKILTSINKALKIEIDKDLNIPVYKIIDLQTQEVLKQIPLEDILKLKKAITEILSKERQNQEALKGLFLEKEV